MFVFVSRAELIVHSEVQSFGRALILSVEDRFFALAKVFVVHFHSTFTQRHETGFRADGLKRHIECHRRRGRGTTHFDIGTTEIIFGHDQLFEIDIIG